jgi:hypothetical protein
LGKRRKQKTTPEEILPAGLQLLLQACHDLVSFSGPPEPRKRVDKSWVEIFESRLKSLQLDLIFGSDAPCLQQRLKQ